MIYRDGLHTWYLITTYWVSHSYLSAIFQARVTAIGDASAQIAGPEGVLPAAQWGCVFVGDTPMMCWLQSPYTQQKIVLLAIWPEKLMKYPLNQRYLAKLKYNKSNF